MAYIKLDSKNLNIHVMVGVLEEYKPPRGMKTLNEEINKLKKETEDFLKKTFPKKSNSEIQKILKKEDKKREKWIEFLKEKYNPKLKKLIDKIDKLNEKICPNYKEISHKEKSKEE